jgi:hypothetical protein
MRRWSKQNAALLEEIHAALAVTDRRTAGLEQLVSRFAFRAQDDGPRLAKGSRDA